MRTATLATAMLIVASAVVALAPTAAARYCDNPLTNEGGHLDVDDEWQCEPLGHFWPSDDVEVSPP